MNITHKKCARYVSILALLGTLCASNYLIGRGGGGRGSHASHAGRGHAYHGGYARRGGGAWRGGRWAGGRRWGGYRGGWRHWGYGRGWGWRRWNTDWRWWGPVGANAWWWTGWPAHRYYTYYRRGCEVSNDTDAQVTVFTAGSPELPLDPGQRLWLPCGQRMVIVLPDGNAIHTRNLGGQFVISSVL